MIITPDQRLRVFISSTLDLADERAAARRAIESLGLTPVMFEAGARPHPPRALYAAYVEQSDIFVAIYSRRYGWTAPGMEVSGLEDEYLLSQGKPRLVYLAADVEREPQLDSFLDRVREGGPSYKPFTAAEDLEGLLKRDLMVLLSERFHGSAGQGRSRGTPAPLPVPPTPFVGRDAELAHILAELRADRARPLTLTGPGGIGKTRLAIEAARRVAAEFPGGTYFVSLAALREPDLVAEAIAAALDVSTSDAYPALRAVQEFIGDRRTLMILDNFEQVVSAAATIAELLAGCGNLEVIVTSRAGLRIRGERQLEVAPLALPDRDVAWHSIGEYAAVELFIDALRGVRPDFELDEATAATVVAICRQLDGLPLALELAAAMARVLTPQMLLDRLRDRLPDVGGGLRDVPERHQRLRDTIAWSYELLDAPTQEVFAQLSVFRGGFTLDAAARVCRTDGDVMSPIALLVEQSLVTADVDGHHGARFSMLGTIRQFARERLRHAPFESEVRGAHAQLFLDMAARVDEPGGRAPAVLDEVELELDNVRGAFAWCAETGGLAAVAATLWQSWWFWWMRGYLNEAKLWADRCLAVSDLPRESRAHALAARGMFGVWSGEYELAVRAIDEVRRTARAVGDDRMLGYADVASGLVHGMTAQGDEGAATIRRGITTFEDVGDDSGATSGLVAMSWLQAITRRFDPSDTVIREALRRAEQLGSDIDVGIAQSALAQFRLVHGDRHDVLDLMSSSLEHLAGARHLGSTILALEVIAEIGIAAGLWRGPATILGATAGIRAAMGTQVPPHAAARLDALIGRGRDAGGHGFDRAYARGSALGFTEAVGQGRALLDELQAMVG